MQLEPDISAKSIYSTAPKIGKPRLGGVLSAVGNNGGRPASLGQNGISSSKSSKLPGFGAP